MPVSNFDDFTKNTAAEDRALTAQTYDIQYPGGKCNILIEVANVR